MTTFFTKTKLYIYLIGTLLVLPFFFGWTLHAANDLLRQAFSESEYSDTTIDVGKNVQTVWNKVTKWSFSVWTDGIWKSPSIIVKVTRLLLILTSALSITMILYNGMIYIIETWQWKEWKSLIKNVWLIVVWILVSLFSVVIINLIQSVPTTIDKELPSNNDNSVLKWKKMTFGEFFKGITGGRAKKEYTVTVRYVDEKWKKIEANTGGKYESGQSFYFKNPTITWYTISGDEEGVGGKLSGNDLEFTVIYNTNPVTIDDTDYDNAITTAKEYFDGLGLKTLTEKVDWVVVWFVQLENWQIVNMIEAYYLFNI